MVIHWEYLIYALVAYILTAAFVAHILHIIYTSPKSQAQEELNFRLCVENSLALSRLVVNSVMYQSEQMSGVIAPLTEVGVRVKTLEVLKGLGYSDMEIYVDEILRNRGKKQDD